MDRTVFQLRVKQSGTDCNFDLSWGKGQTISVELNYPLSLKRSYEQWQSAYLNYYRHLRGRKVISGTGTVPTDRREELVKAEKKLLGEFQLGEFQLGEFQRWLLSPELVSIRSTIASATKPEPHWVEVFLTCTPLELAWLPWETWDIGSDLGTPQRIRIARTPANIFHEPVRPIRRKARVLAIFGDNTGLNLEGDREALRSLHRIADIKLIGWQRNEKKTEVKIPKGIEAEFFDANALKMKIPGAIADARGWDILFFAGHSNESALTGGELRIAPDTSISITEIEESLKQAKQRGLQFAIFNSCSGINIAESLINLGLSQVVVMREPIHNQVAQEFLVQFLQSLAQYKDVHEALLNASQFLKQQEKRLSYPSAYLVPSLFRHPEAELFRIERFGILKLIKRWLPTRQEAGWLLGFLLLSLLPPVQDLLMEPRLLLQSVYRQLTFQVPSHVDTPLLLVQIDNKSLLADDKHIKQRLPMDYSYLAKLIQNISQRKANLIGIDYILDQVEQQPQDSQKLRRSIQESVKGGTWFVFAHKANQDPRKGRVSPQIASSNWSLEGDINFYTWYVELLPANTDCSKTCPFAYLLALAHSLQAQKSPPAELPKPNLNSQKDFRSLVINPKNGRGDRTAFLYQLRLHPISSFLQWFQPIIDFSIPPERAYQSISACELLGSCEGKRNLPNNLDRYVVIIAPGGYEEAGLEEEDGHRHSDNYTIPLAVTFWRGWGDGIFPGGEAHAYMFHHLMMRRLVVPIPDFWMILLAALLGKGVTLLLPQNPIQLQRWVMRLRGATVVYIIVSLQIYISVAVLIPWFLPSVAFWNSLRLALRKKSHGQS